MSFEQIQFKYTPPPTVAAAIATSQVASASVLSGSGTTAAESAAGRLIARLAALLDANQYLQQVLLTRSSGLGIEFDASSDPETARSLEAIYGSVPTSLTISMYNRMLDAEMTSMQIGAGLGNGGAYEVNPFQTASVNQVNQTIENGLLQSGQFQTLLPLLLRQLKGDAVIFNNMSAQLAQYPVVASPTAASVTISNPNVVPMAGLDVSDPLALNLNDSLDSFESSYASVYQLSAGVGVVAQDVNSVLSAYVLEPAARIISMITLFQSLQGFVHAARLKTIVNGLSGLVFVQLMVEASAMRMMLDQFVQTAVQPIRMAESGIISAVNAIDQAAASIGQVVNGVKQTFTNTKGALKGCSMAYNCGLPHNANIKKPLSPGLDYLPEGVKAMASHLDWALNYIPKKLYGLEESFDKLMNRRLSDMNGQLDLMCSIQALNTSVQLAQSVMAFKSSLPAIGASDSVSQTAAAGKILSGMTSTTGTSFVVTNGQIQAIPPSVPTPSNSVQTLLNKGGLNLIVASSSNVSAPSIGVTS